MKIIFRRIFLALCISIITARVYQGVKKANDDLRQDAILYLKD